MKRQNHDKIKEFEKIFPLLNGKRVRFNDGYIFEATIVGWTGLYILLQDARDFRNEPLKTDSIHVKWVRKMKVVDQSKTETAC